VKYLCYYGSARDIGMFELPPLDNWAEVLQDFDMIITDIRKQRQTETKLISESVCTLRFL
jgi:hypothetical protein